MNHQETAPRPLKALGFPMVPLVLGISVTLALLAISAWTIRHFYASLRDLALVELRIRQLSGDILYLDEAMTMSCRVAALTGDRALLDRYHRLEPQLAEALDEAVRLASPGPTADAFRTTHDVNDELVALEKRSLQLVQAADLEEAQKILTNPHYLALKSQYTEAMLGAAGHIATNTSSRLKMHESLLWKVVSIAGLLCLCLCAGWYQIIRRIREYTTAHDISQAALSQANAELEAQVADRTVALSSSNEKLRREMNERNRVEVELRHAQKLESVGRLAAGIAHEINTPVQFVGHSVHFVRDAATSLSALLGAYRDLVRVSAGGPVPPEAVADIQRIEKEAELDYISEELPKAINRSLEGLDRVATIVRAMKEFAHPGGPKAPADLNRTIRNTVTITHNECKYVADVVTDLGELPMVPCHLGDLNQAILNIIVNGAHAIADRVKGTNERGTLWIRSRCEGNFARIEIEDTGGGIPESIRDRVFEPFFTTKEVGRGTGQGLALAHSVVADRHGGTLTFETEMGKGTRFIILLPLEEDREEGVNANSLPAAA